MPGAIDIRPDGLEDSRVHALLGEHLQDMALHSPPESIHALDISALRQPCISFWTAWDMEVLLGCAALKSLGDGHGEIKSMRTARLHQRRGVAVALLGHVIDEARQRGYGRLSLETGSMEAFAPAHALYARFGFIDCEPFGDYAKDPFSRFMTLALPCIPVEPYPSHATV